MEGDKEQREGVAKSSVVLLLLESHVKIQPGRYAASTSCQFLVI